MTTYKEMVVKLSDTATRADMEELTEITDEFIEGMRKNHPDDVHKLLMKIDLMLNPMFTKETAEYAVSKMKNEDGTEGGHWDYDTTTSVLRSKGYDFNPCDWYYVLNMVYSDYFTKDQPDDYYFKLAYDFLKDKDAPVGKAKKYFLAMHS